MSLTDFLIEKSVICKNTLQDVLKISEQTGSSLEDILISHNHVNPKDLYVNIAGYNKIEFADLKQYPCEKEIVDSSHRPFYKSLNAIPWKREGDGVIIAATKITDDLKKWASVNFEKYRFAITTPFDIHHNINKLFVDKNNFEAIDILSRYQPQFSAKFLFKNVQTKFLILFFIAMSCLFFNFPKQAILTSFVIVSFFYGTTLIVKTLLFIIGMIRNKRTGGAQELVDLKDKELPIYTILVPLYKETRVLRKLTDAILNLDYPKSKLDVKLIVEEDDIDTIEAIKELRCERIFEIIEVPFSMPRTKPKACNYALQFAKGDFVTIYDAEDIPDPQQLKKVLNIFYNEDENIKCVQCKLNYFNREENLLSRLFSIEYSTLFDFLLFGLEAMKIPIPLGGTSNHFRKTTLEELYGWDPYNVTEDADLGIRIAQKGWQCKIINSTTLEECPIKIKAWIRQRSRWIKGHMQTYFVHMRNPNELYKKTGLVGFMGIQFFLGAPVFIFLISPIMWALCLCFLLGVLQLPANMPIWFYSLMDISIIMLVIGNILHMIQAYVAVQQSGWKGMTVSIIVYPFYWLLHSVASFKALYQLITRPFYWEKTNHGETSFFTG